MSIDYQGSGGGVPRKTAKIFASDAANNDVTIFGSTLNGTTAYTTDIADIQNEYFEDGWRSAVISNKNYPLLADMNGVQKTFSQQIAYVLQHGIPQWDSATKYYTYDIVNVNGVLYISTIDSNTNNNPTGGTGWAKYYEPATSYRQLIEISDPADMTSVPCSWYKVWEEYDPTTGDYVGKWCEQGGVVIDNLINNAFGDRTISLAKSYNNTSYIINLTAGSRGGSVDNEHITNYILTSFGLNDFQYNTLDPNHSSQNGEVSWEAKGYITEGE